MPEVDHFANEDEVLADWNAFMKVRSDVLKALEKARNAKVIGSHLKHTLLSTQLKKRRHFSIN